VFVLNLTDGFDMIFIHWKLSESWCVFSQGWKGRKLASKGALREMWLLSLTVVVDVDFV